MSHAKRWVVSACIAFALAGVGCDSGASSTQSLAGAGGGTAGAGGTAGLGGASGGAVGGSGGAGGTGGLGGMTAGAAGFASTGGLGGAGGGPGGVGGAAGAGTAGTAGMAGAGGVAGVAGSGGAGGMVVQTDAIPCEVAMVVIEACHRCHGAMKAFGAPMSLATLADFQRDYAVVTTKQLVGRSLEMYELARIRINREMGTSPMPQGPPLTAEELTLLNTWLTNGAPGGAACPAP